MSPGPWTIKPSSEPGALDIWTKNGRNITVRGAWKEDNARLVAAAPDLLEALRNLLEEVDYQRSLGDFGAALSKREKGRAAIAKATEGGV